MKVKILKAVTALSVVVATLFFTATAAHAYSRWFGLYTGDGGFYGGWGQGRLHSSADDYSRCARLWVAEGKIRDQDADGHGVIAWLAYTDCATGARKYFKLGSVAVSGNEAPLTTASVYNAKHPSIMMCLYDGTSQMKACASSW
ncbi:hypothetical protein [Streptomyces sp. V1I6]|jgi:hypothetical protein|uniref:hypothetical protein n=1 Tax=Streptomyces sp. V1I6 TaxID=3042273 RepID=UPI0027803904|nr:hypothetical protein [Streptomyces sp. V1I6]MDQ0847600.1 hypothetical protein [Streptomyces sp. V1I6]